MENYYEILGIAKTDDINEIKTAYKKQIKMFHPDKNKDINSVEKFIQIKKAYEYLCDKEKKNELDDKLSRIKVRKKYEKERKDMINNLLKREKESKHILNNKRYRTPTYESQSYKDNSTTNSTINTKNECLKLKFKEENEIEFSNEIIKAYFSSFGKIDSIKIDSKRDIAYVKYDYYINIDKVMSEAKEDKGINVLFDIDKEKWYKAKNRIERKEKDNNNEAINIIKSQKIVNEVNTKSKIDLASISLENLEDEIFK